ncbi:MAG: Na+/melibiose symporter and related transporter [Clostridiales bacterium]|nr:Na+/melibiose symporter and related transporter [Clostridiales bacterium]
MSKNSSRFWDSPLTRSAVRSDAVRMPEMLLGYFIGPFGALLSSGIFTSMLQNYFTDVLKLDLAFLTALQLISTFLIVAANLIVGQLIERTRTKAGKARPWILLSALGISVSSVLMFIVPLDGTAKLVWIAIAYNLYYSVAYPIYNTANSTLIPVSTRDSKARGALASFTNVAGLGVMGCGSMIFPMLVSFALKEDQNLWFLAMLAIAIFSALTIYLQYRFTRERVTEEGASDVTDTPKAASLSQQLKAVASEKWWWIIILFYMGFQWSGAFKNGSMTYFCKWVLDNTFFGSADAWGASQSLLSILGAIPMAAASVVVVPLANKFGKRLVSMIGMIVGAAGGVIAGLGGGNIVPVAIGVALKCLGSAPACYLILAMLADVIDHIEYKSGIRTDGLTMSIYSSVMVAATPICNAIFSAMLGGSGYDQAADIALGTLGQTAAVQSAISVSYIWIETIAYVICAALIFFFTVEKNLPEEQKAIAERKGL